MALPVIGEEVVGQERDVLLPLAKRGSLIGTTCRRRTSRPQNAAVDRVLRLAVDVGSAGHRHGVLVFAADPADDAVLDHPQELGLKRQGHLGKLIEEQGATVGRLQQAGLVTIGTSKGALPVAELFGFSNPGSEPGAVDRHQGAAHPPAVLMDELGEVRSLPVPPLISTEASVPATFRAGQRLPNRGEMPIRAMFPLWPCCRLQLEPEIGSRLERRERRGQSAPGGESPRTAWEIIPRRRPEALQCCSWGFRSSTTIVSLLA